MSAGRVVLALLLLALLGVLLFVLSARALAQGRVARRSSSLLPSPEQVVARLDEYAAVGVDTFVLSGYPHLEEAIRFAELAFPLIAGKGPVTLRESNQTGGAFDIRATTGALAAAG